MSHDVREHITTDLREEGRTLMEVGLRQRRVSLLQNLERQYKPIGGKLFVGLRSKR